MKPERIYRGPILSPKAILDSRTDRARRQRDLLTETSCASLISFTLNLPGAVKQFPLAAEGFRDGLRELRTVFSGHIAKETLREADTGNEALLALDLSPSAVKRETVRLEELHPLGRLFDIDVLGPDGTGVSRTALGLSPRACLLCGENAKICARSRAHSLDALKIRIAGLLDGYFRDQTANLYASYATRALLYEVSTTPKPGLVDRANSGSHKDMDFFTFLDSSAVLSPWFREMFCIGWDHADEKPNLLFSRLRFAGRKAEEAMFAATGGVNTHKGLIFSLGLLCGALGVIRSDFTEPVAMERVLALCSEFGRLSLMDFSDMEVSENADPGTSTNGMRCYRNYRLTGVRGEAASGFPLVVRIGLLSLRKLTAQGLSVNDAAAITLLALLAHTDDTNMIHRGGVELAQAKKAEAADLLGKLRPNTCGTLLTRLDADYIAANLSPGGCADLLAMSLMLYFLESEEHITFSG